MKCFCFVFFIFIEYYIVYCTDEKFGSKTNDELEYKKANELFNKALKLNPAGDSSIDNGVNAVNNYYIIFAINRLANAATEGDRNKAEAYLEKIKDDGFKSKLNSIYDKLPAEEKGKFGREVYENIEVYSNLLDTNLPSDDFVNLYKFLLEYNTKEENKNVSKAILKGKFFKFIVNLFGIEGLKDVSSFISELLNKYNELPVEFRELLEKLSEQCGKNMEKVGLTKFFELLGKESESIIANIGDNVYVAQFQKSLESIFTEFSKNKDKIKSNLNGYIEYDYYIGRYKKNFETTKELFSKEKMLDGLSKKMEAITFSCKARN